MQFFKKKISNNYLQNFGIAYNSFKNIALIVIFYIITRQ